MHYSHVIHKQYIPCIIIFLTHHKYIITYQKLTPNLYFISFFNCRTSILICHVFFNTPKKDLIESCTFKHNKGKKVLSKCMDKEVIMFLCM